MEALQQPPKVAAAASLLQILRLPCKAKPLQGAHLHRAPTLQSGLISFLLQADPPPRPLGVVGGANPPPPSGPLTQAPSYSLRSQLPKCPHPKETSFLIASVATLGGGWGGPSNRAPLPLKPACCFPSMVPQDYGQGPHHHHEAVCSLVSGP